MAFEALNPGRTLIANGTPRVIKTWNAEWSLKLEDVPHKLWILFEGDTEYQRFTSDATGEFHDLDTPNTH